MTNEHGAARAWSSGFSLASAATKEPTAEAQDVRKIVAPASRRHGGWTTPFASTLPLPAGSRRYISLTTGQKKWRGENSFQPGKNFKLHTMCGLPWSVSGDLAVKGNRVISGPL